jgi:6-phosphogluconolactonase (cycloisomerase 2 family)
LLVVSDFSSGTIYFIENARDAFSQNQTLSPNQSLSGALTQISQPIDVAIDDREDKSFLYVADRGKKKIMRFKLSDRGNIAPAAVFTTKLTPVSIYLDAR